MADVLITLLLWIPIVIWLVLAVVGLYYGYKEVSESLVDIEAVKEDRLDHVTLDKDPRLDVAQGNYSTAWKNLATQGIFMFVGLLTVFLRVFFHSEFDEVNLARSIILPFVLVAGEGFLVSQMVSMSVTRKLVSDKSRAILLEKEKTEGRAESQKTLKARAENEKKILGIREESEAGITKNRADNEIKMREDDGL